jgi:glycosyltransferase involved in cell wall biosynthesis
MARPYATGESLRVGFLSAKNYFSTDAFSGTLLSMWEALRDRGLELIPLGHPTRSRRLFWLRRRLLRVGPLSVDDPQFEKHTRRLARFIERQLRTAPCDVIFAPVASVELWSLRTSLPIVYSSDATFHLIHESYGLSLTHESEVRGHEVERHAIATASRLVYPSEWAVRSAIDDYGATPEQIDIVPYGANLRAIPSREAVLAKRLEEPMRLLFVGREYARKGGAIVLQTCRELERRGFCADITMIGCEPPASERIPSNLTVIPNLDKRKPSERAMFDKLYEGAHALLFPTRADCSPITICESFAHGIPVISADVGGIRSMIEHGRNGFLIPKDDVDGKFYADSIKDLAQSQQRYSAIVHNARSSYEDRLNWKTWGESVEQSLRIALDTGDDSALGRQL